MKFTLQIWRQDGPASTGRFERHDVDDIDADMSFLELLEVLNERLVEQAKDPVALEYDCREGICGTCGIVINGSSHGPVEAQTTCQTYMRSFRDGDELFLEPFRADSFPVIKDLMVDRSSFDRILLAGGYVSANTGSAPDGNAVPIPNQDAEAALDAASCIGCGACVASCPNASASLFVAAKISHLGHLPQGQPERLARVRKMVEVMDEEGFGSCSNHSECHAACPKLIPLKFIGQMNRDYMRSVVAPTP